MKIYPKTAATIGCTLLALIAILYFVTTRALMGQFSRLEVDSVKRDLERVRKAYEEVLIGIDVMVRDWSEWDNAYDFMEQPTQEFIADNIQATTFYTLAVDNIVFFDMSGRIIGSFSFDRVTGKMVPMLPGLLEKLSFSSPIFSGAVLDGSFRGNLQVGSHNLLVVARPILKSNAGGPPRGVLVMTRFLDNQVIGALGDRTGTHLEFYNLDDPLLSDDCKNILGKMQSNNFKPQIKPRSNSQVSGYMVLKDPWDKPFLLAVLTVPRDIYRQGKQTMGFILSLLLVVGLVFAVLMLFLLNRIILHRLTRMCRAMTELGKSGRLGHRLQTSGQDEITELAMAVNHMLADLDEANQRRRKAEVRQRRQNEILVDLARSETVAREQFDKAIQEISLAATLGLDCEQVSIWLADREKERLTCKNLYLAESGRHFGGFEVELGLLTQYAAFMGAKRVALLDETFRRNLLMAEQGSHGRNATSVSLLAITILDEGQVVGLVCAFKHQAEYKWGSDEEEFTVSIAGFVSRALSSEKQRRTEDDLRRLASFDGLTGLPNRASFSRSLEEFLGRAQREMQLMALLFLDLDQFKRINDNLGHEVGDVVLKEVSRRMASCMRVNDVVSRHGGDEFTILLDHVLSVENCERVARKIIDEVARPIRVNEQLLQVGCSIGIAMFPADGQDPTELMQKADAAMYKAKLSGRGTYHFHGEGQKTDTGPDQRSSPARILES